MYKDIMAYLADGGSSLSPWMQANIGITPQLAGLYAHSAMANFFKSNTSYRDNWFPEKTGSIWKLDITWRADLQYKNNGVNAIWELKPISHFADARLALMGMSQVNYYADMETYTQHKKFYVGSSNGAPIPPINGQTLTHMGYQFSYTVPFGSDGMIYYNCLNCNSPQREMERETSRQTERKTQITPQTVNQIGTGTLILMILTRAAMFIPT